MILNSADNSLTSLELAPVVHLEPTARKVLEVSTNSEEAINMNSSSESVAAKPLDNEEPVLLDTTNESMDTSKESVVETETINERKMTAE